MTTMVTTVGAPSARIITWTSINWRVAQDLVYRLQMRIAKAIKLGQRKSKVSRAAPQWPLRSSSRMMGNYHVRFLEEEIRVT
jgi:hypothetical protein